MQKVELVQIPRCGSTPRRLSPAATDPKVHGMLREIDGVAERRSDRWRPRRTRAASADPCGPGYCLDAGSTRRHRAAAASCIASDEVDEVLAEVRALLRERGRPSTQ